MLRREADVREVAQVLLKERAVAPGDDPHDVFRVQRELLERFQRRLRGRRHRRRLHNRRQRPLQKKLATAHIDVNERSTHVIVEQEQALLRALVTAIKLVLRDVRRLPRGTRQAHLPKEHLHEHRGPGMRRVRGDDLVQLGVPCGLLFRVHSESLVDRRRDVLPINRSEPKRNKSASNRQCARPSSRGSRAARPPCSC